MTLTFETKAIGTYDTYDETFGVLSIPLVQVEGRNYYNVKVTISKVISIDGGIPNQDFDTYRSDTSTLNIPSVSVQGNIYTNVRVGIERVLCVKCQNYYPFTDGSVRNIAQLGNTFTLSNYGFIDNDQSNSLNGKPTIHGKFFGDSIYNRFLKTNTTTVKLLANKSYSVSYDYKIVEKPTNGFEVLFFSQVGAASNNFLPSKIIFGNPGDTGSASLNANLGSFQDYVIIWNIIGKGEILINNIIITDTSTGLVIAKEAFNNFDEVIYFNNARSFYLLNSTPIGLDVINKIDGTHTIVPFTKAMLFKNAIKYSKDAKFIVSNVRSHAEAYTSPEELAELPVDFLRTASNYDFGPNGVNGRNYSPFSSKFTFPDRSSKVIVSYINSMEFGATDSNWDISFDPSWDKNKDYLIDLDAGTLPDYVDRRVFNIAWKNYVAAYWMDSWKQQIKLKIDLAATQHFDGVMFDVMTSYWEWNKSHPELSVAVLRQRYVELAKWSYTYAKINYGSSFLITYNLDHSLIDYFPEAGKYMDAGYNQNAFYSWDGAGIATGAFKSEDNANYSNNKVDYLKSQRLQFLSMDHLGTGIANNNLDFVNYDSQINTEKFYSLFDWAIKSGATPFLTTVFMGAPYSYAIPRFVRVIPGLPIFTGSSYPEWIIGSSAGETISTGNSDSVVYGGGGDDIIFGGNGTNTAYYLGSKSRYTISRSNERVYIKDITGIDGADTLFNIKYLKFSDQIIESDSL